MVASARWSELVWFQATSTRWRSSCDRNSISPTRMPGEARRASSPRRKCATTRSATHASKRPASKSSWRRPPARLHFSVRAKRSSVEVAETVSSSVTLNDTLEEGRGYRHLAPALDALQGGYRERPRPLPLSLGRHDPLGHRHLRVDRGPQGQDPVRRHQAAEQDVSLARVEREKNRPDALHRSTGTGASVRGEALESPVRVRRQRRTGCRRAPWSGRVPDPSTTAWVRRGPRESIAKPTRPRSACPPPPDHISLDRTCDACRRCGTVIVAFPVLTLRREKSETRVSCGLGSGNARKYTHRPPLRSRLRRAAEPICVLCRPFAARNSYRHVARSVCEPP